MRFRTESVEYLKTRTRLPGVEHWNYLRVRNVQVIRFVGWQKGIKAPAFFPAIITVAWRELATTVANKRNGNQMQIWLPFVFYSLFIPLLLIKVSSSVTNDGILRVNVRICMRRVDIDSLFISLRIEVIQV